MERELLMNEENDEIEIDLMELFRALKKRIWIILAVAVLSGGIAGAYSKFILIPQFQSTSMVYILSKETTLTSLADLQIGSQLTQDYKIIVTSRPVLEAVIEKLNLNLEYEDLKQKITINNPKDTRILSITAQDPDSKLAKEIVDTVAKISSEYIGDIMEMMPPKIIENGVVETKKFSPNNTKNTLIGAALGMLVVCSITVLEVLLNDTIRTENDVEKYLGISVLASVPARRDELPDDGKKIYIKDSRKRGEKKSRKKKRGGRS